MALWFKTVAYGTVNPVDIGVQCVQEMSEHEVNTERYEVGNYGTMGTSKIHKFNAFNSLTNFFPTNLRPKRTAQRVGNEQCRE